MQTVMIITVLLITGSSLNIE